MMSDHKVDNNEYDSEFVACLETHLRKYGEYSSWADAPDDFLEQATELAEKELGRKRRG